MNKFFSKRSYGYTLLILSWFGWIALYLCKSVLPPILPILFDELKITHAQGGMLETAYLVGYVLIKIPAGMIANRIGFKQTLLMGIMGYGLVTALNFFSSSFIHLLILRFFLGLFQGVHLPLANTLLSEWFGDRQGKAIGFHESGPNVGNSFAYPFTVAIVSALGWRWAFPVISLTAFFQALAVTVFLKSKKPIEQTIEPEDEEDDTIRLKDFSRLLIPLGLAHAVYTMCLSSLFIFAPAYLVEYREMTITLAGLLSTLTPATGIIAKISSGFIADFLGRKRAICISMGLTGFLIFLLTVVKSSHLMFNFILLGFSLYSFSPIIYSSVTFSLPRKLKSVGLGTVTMMGNAVGALSTFLIGYLIDVKGYVISLQVVSVVVLLCTLIYFAVMNEE